MKLGQEQLKNYSTNVTIQSLPTYIYDHDIHPNPSSAIVHFKAIGHFRNRQKRVHRCMKCFTFCENIKTIINPRYQELRIYFKHMSWRGETCGNKGGFSRYFLPTLMTDWALIFTGLLFYISCHVIHRVWAFGQSVYRQCLMALGQVTLKEFHFLTEIKTSFTVTELDSLIIL